jgi:hypothetical protein
MHGAQVWETFCLTQLVQGPVTAEAVSLADEFKSMPGTFAQAGKDIGTEAAKIPRAIADAPGWVKDS